MRKIAITTLSVIALTLAFANATVDAQVVPFKSVGTNNVYNPTTMVFGGVGHTRHMGKSTGSGVAIPTPTGDPLVLDWTASGEFVAANGDKIFFSGGGQVFLNPLGGTMFTATWIGDFNIDGGTGRFANVGAGPDPLAVTAINHPFDIVNDQEWLYDYVITGKMDLGRKK